ncbi:MAG TPA: cell division ATP-binding protein FtsE [Gemmatimonadaceae bacterium]|nr:cell division ATP-binding protein FtsE [Gemmatimonadaceae bacterium]
MIRFLHVTKEYPRTGAALKDATFRIGKGEFAFLTGPSGSGKSTLLKLSYADERPSSGEVRVAGMSVSKLRRREVPLLRRKLGIIFQDFRLLEDRTAEENIAFALEVTGAASNVIPGKVARLLQQVGLGSKAASYPNQLSGGEQQRVAIARALANDPYVVIADEPTGNLDDRATRGIFQLLQDINMAGTAVLMATHDLELVRRADYRVLELNRGQLVFDSAETSTPATTER